MPGVSATTRSLTAGAPRSRKRRKTRLPTAPRIPRPASSRAAWGGALALLALAGIAGEFRSPLNGDAAYMLDAARRMLAGERLYAGLIDLNPPFVFWLSELAIVISRIGVDPADVLRVIV